MILKTNHFFDFGYYWVFVDNYFARVPMGSQGFKTMGV